MAGCAARRSTEEGRWDNVTTADANGQAGSDTDSFQSVGEDIAEERATPPATPPAASPRTCSGGKPHYFSPANAGPLPVAKNPTREQP